MLHSVEEEDRYFLILHCAPAMVSVFNDILFPPNQTLSPTSFFTSPTRKFPRSRPNPILRCSIAEESTESRPKTGDSPPPPLMEALAVWHRPGPRHQARQCQHCWGDSRVHLWTMRYHIRRPDTIL